MLIIQWQIDSMKPLLNTIIAFVLLTEEHVYIGISTRGLCKASKQIDDGLANTLIHFISKMKTDLPVMGNAAAGLIEIRNLMSVTANLFFGRQCP